ncbi:MAG: NlpC/P60 family protein, partial [Acidimicrobiales bacterium]
LVVTDQAAGATATDVQGLLSSPQIISNTVTLDDTQTPLAQVAAIIAAQPQPANLIVMNMGSGTPDQAAALLALLPPGQQVLWVAPPTQRGVAPAAAAPAVTAAYLAAVAARPNFRVETVPAALAVVTTGSDVAPTATWPDVGAKVVSSMVSNYAGTAYNLPLGSAQASTVLAYAEAQLGKPYVWAAAGPSSFDCSGLTMQAFAQVGLNYIHNAYEQYEATKANAVSPANLQPGDLVFFGPNESGIHHVGIYVGNNQFIDAPDTGSVVRFDTLGPGWDFFGATDPLGASPFLAGLFKTAGSVNTTPGSTAGLDLNHTFAKALSDATWDPTQYPYLVLLWNRESGWNPAAKNPSSGAFGIPQALPAAKMGSAGPDWATDPLTQIMWGLSYI